MVSVVGMISNIKNIYSENQHYSVGLATYTPENSVFNGRDRPPKDLTRE